MVGPGAQRNKVGSPEQLVLHAAHARRMPVKCFCRRGNRAWVGLNSHQSLQVSSASVREHDNFPLPPLLPPPPQRRDSLPLQPHKSGRRAGKSAREKHQDKKGKRTAQLL